MGFSFKPIVRLWRSTFLCVGAFAVVWYVLARNSHFRSETEMVVAIAASVAILAIGIVWGWWVRHCWRLAGARPGDAHKPKENQELSRLLAAFDEFPEVVFVVGPDHAIRYANTAFRNHFGDPGDKACFRVIADRARPCENCPACEALETNKSNQWEWTSPQGTCFVIHDVPFEDVDGSKLVLTIAVDMTDSKRTEEELRVKNVWLDGAERLAHVGCWNWHVPTGKVMWSDETYRIFHLDPKVFKPDIKTVLSQYHPDFQAKDVELIAWANAHRQGGSFVTKLMRNDGKLRALLSTVEPKFDEKGELAFLMGVVQDVTDVRRAEEELARSRTLLETLIEQSPVGIQVCDAPGGTITMMNKEAERICGRSRDTFLAKDESHREDGSDKCAIDYFNSDGSRGEVDDYPLTKAILRGEPTTNREINFRRTDGTSVPVICNAVPIRDPKGDTIAGMMMFMDITDRKATEAALVESEQRLAEAQRLAHVGYWNWHVPTGNVTWSDETYRIFQQAPETFTPDITTVLSQFHPDSQNTGEELVDWARRNRQRRSHIVKIVRGDGELRTLLATVEPKFDENDELIFLMGAIQDITDVKRAEAQLRESEKRLKMAQELANVGSFEWIVGTGHVIWSDQMYHIHGMDPATFVTEIENIKKLAHPKDVKQHFDRMAQINFNHPRGESEYWFNRPNGERRRARCSFEGRFNEKKELYSIVGTVHDITDQYRAEIALTKSRAMLEAVVDQSPVGVVVSEPEDWGITIVNAEAERIFGQTRDKILGVTFDRRDELKWELCDTNGDPIPLEESPLPTAILQGVATASREMIIRSADGGHRIVLSNAAPIYGADGKLLACIVTLLDITDHRRVESEREKLEGQLRQAQKMEAVGQLAGGVAHDFNNILTAIIGNAEMLLAEVESRFAVDDPMCHSLKTIEQSAERAARLTRQLLVFSRRDVVKMTLLNLNVVIDEIKAMLRRLISEDITLNFNIAEDLVSCRADRGQIEQVIVNLVVNARDAISESGTVSIGTENADLDEVYIRAHSDARIGKHAVLVVSDTGCGMDPETLDRVFEPFFTTKPVGQGTGLGLATVYGIVKQAGGHVAVYSEQGRGSVFKVYLPKAIGDGDIEDEAVHPESASGGTETVLVCEDDPTVRTLADQLLTEAGYTVIAAEDGMSALDVIRHKRCNIDLLLTDVIMPGINGRVLADRLTEVCPDVKVLFMSGYTNDIIAHHGVLDVDAEFLAKPFTRYVLLTTVRRTLDGNVGGDQ